MVMRKRFISIVFLMVVLAMGVFLGNWVIVGLAHKPSPALQQLDARLPGAPIPMNGPGLTPTQTPADPQSGDNAELGEPGEMVIQFATEEAFRAFLAGLKGSDVRLLGQLDALRAVRVGYASLGGLTSMLGDDAEVAANFPVTLPDPVDGGVQPGAVGLGRSLLEWLGIDGDNSKWGKGVLVAVLDTGVGEHPTLSGVIRRADDVAQHGDLSSLNGHGTAVASLIAGSNGLAAGVAPGANLLSVRITNEAGTSDSFSLAAGIIAAVDGGAHVINISMGSYGNASIVYDAVRYAQQRGSVIVASAGNDAAGQPSYPAAYPGVISVGAVDARGEHLAFSNTGANLSLAAPGYEVNAAWPNRQLIGFTGTSASAPIVSGAIAATMSQGGSSILTAQQAARVVMGNLNDTGAPGADIYYGTGLIDLGRVMRRSTTGVIDAAVAGVVVSPDGNGLLVTVQNRGTVNLVNTAVSVTTGAGSFPMNVTSLPPGGIHTFQVPVSTPANTPGYVTTQVTPTGVDAFPSNNKRSDVLPAR